MTTTAEHYERHLGPNYLWMVGGADVALQAGSAEIEALNLPVIQGAVVLDLGAGFGMLLAFQSHITTVPSAILCMGDTITHLPELAAVESLVERASVELPPGGKLIVSFRDYTVPLVGDQRFIPVRSDEARILTCFLEYEAETVLVHDILHERTTDGWQTRVSHYRKLRLSPEHLVTTLQSCGFSVRREARLRGMVRLVAESV
jgi:hypothetical protein